MAIQQGYIERDGLATRHPGTSPPGDLCAIEGCTCTEDGAAPGFVYMLASCVRGSWRTYVGWTNDVPARLEAHNTGKGAKSTRGRHWDLIHTEQHPCKRSAMSAEYALKKDRVRRQAILRGFRGSLS